MHKHYLEFDKAKPLINEADVLLFRGRGLIADLIGRSNESTYTHVGVASWVNGRKNTIDGILECVEFREGSLLGAFMPWSPNVAGGGRSVSLRREVDKYPEQIDVYRPLPIYRKYEFDIVTNRAEMIEIVLEPRRVTDIMRRMAGLPYGWQRIWWLMKHKMAGFRLFYDKESLMIDAVSTTDPIYPVCSTSVAYAFNTLGYDLTKNKGDEWTEPGDIARSSHLSYLFTLTP